ncbi:MAG: hypothetical protein ACREPM_02885 [Gemmatimonadaceae bacterium]
MTAHPLTETRERFLRAILADVPADRVAEVHFFVPIKQGGIESGVAVVAAWPESPAVVIADAAEPEATPPAPAPDRHVVYTARYRHTLKGADRGKWETNVVAEADAPLVTVDAVVRGVQRRSGDVDDPARMEGVDVRAFAEAHPPATTSSAPG